VSIAAKAAIRRGRDWEGDDPKGWHVCEKLNGLRCYWDGERAWSKEGNLITLPPHIVRDMPEGLHRDGEIYAGRDGFEIARSAVQYNRWTPDVHFVVFDAPHVAGNWLQRIAAARSQCRHVVTGYVCESYAQLMDNLREVQSGGGEGLMIHSPEQTRYTPGRTGLLLKVKLVLALLE
jgi:DNA ligase-1